MTQGYLALVLHAHLPFVRHPEHEKFLEENWLFEAITESYVPLIQIITCADTHALLPLLARHPPSIRAQILTARDHYRSCFGRDPRGIWLPECAYTAGVEKVVQEANIRWFITDTHGVLHANPRPRFGVFAPIFTPNGIAAFGRDLDSAKQVWSRLEGYPGDPCYRDFYRDIGF